MSVFVRHHVLHVVGTSGDDAIVFHRHDFDHLNVEVNGKLHQLASARIKEIYINAGDGSDYVYVAHNNFFEKGISGPDPNCRVACPQIADEAVIFSLPGTIQGGAGDDTIIGGSGDWILRGGDGADQIHGGLLSSKGVIFGGRGDDTLIGSTGPNRLVGGDGDDLLIGRDGNDMLEGGDGFDVMKGGDGADALIPGPQPRPPVSLLYDA
jgi:Ca2+-binding RTX toxin-like protein